MCAGTRLESIFMGGEQVWNREDWVIKSLGCAGLSEGLLSSLIQARGFVLHPSNLDFP